MARPIRRTLAFTLESASAFRCIMDQGMRPDTGMARAIMLRDIIGDHPGTSIIDARTGATGTGAVIGGTIISLNSEIGL